MDFKWLALLSFVLVLRLYEFSYSYILEYAPLRGAYSCLANVYAYMPRPPAQPALLLAEFEKLAMQCQDLEAQELEVQLMML